jgi:hypothetical protein
MIDVTSSLLSRYPGRLPGTAIWYRFVMLKRYDAMTL